MDYSTSNRDARLARRAAGVLPYGIVGKDYTATLPGGIRVIGVGLAGVASDAGEALVPRFVEQRR